MAAKSVVTAFDVLLEIDKIFEEGGYYQSRESGKRFYTSKKLAALLASYLVGSGQKLSIAAKRFGMGAATLQRIIDGENVSDNMLSRIRSSLAADVAEKTRAATFPAEWQQATSSDVTSAVAVVSEKLVFLKKVIETSNFLHSKESPIDKIQVLQLMALLMATIDALRAPFIDKKQTQGFFRWLGRLVKISTEKGVEKVVVDAMTGAVDAGNDMLHHLAAQAGISDLGDLIK